MLKNIFCLVMLLIFQSCNKEVKESIQNLNEQNAINQIQKIVGNKGKVFLIKESNSNISSLNLNDHNVQKIDIEQFKKIFSQSINDTLPHIFKKTLDSLIKSSLIIKSSSLDYFDDFDGPRPAGLYRYAFGPLQNGNSSFLTNMNISFNTNQDGSIYGTPTIYFSGLTLFSWQVQQNSQISFNSNTYVSTFAMTGTTTFGIQCSGGLTLGWTSTITFYVSINMDEKDSNTVIIKALN
jgi:hypothetical protein